MQHSLKDDDDTPKAANSKLKKKSKEHDTLTLWRFDAIRFLFELYQPYNPIGTFEKILLLCDIFYNGQSIKTEHEDAEAEREAERKLARAQAHKAMGALFSKGR